MIRFRERVGGRQFRLRRVLFGATVAGWLSILSRVVGVALIIPIAFRTLTPSDTVLWLFFANAINFQAILDFGHNTTFARFMAYARAKRGDQDSKVSSVVKNGPDISTILHVIGPAYLSMTIGMMVIALPLLSYVAKTPIQASTEPGLHWVVWLSVCTSLTIQTYGGRYIAVLQGFERVAIQRWIEAGMGVITNVSAGLFLWFSGKMAAAAVSTATVGVLGTLAYSLAVRWTLAQMPAASGTPVTAEKARSARQLIWRSSWRSGVGIICSTGLIQLLGMTVSNIARPIQAASFMFAMRIAQVVSALSQSPFYNHLPTLARKYQEHDLIAVRMESRSRMFGATLIVSIGFVAIGIMGPLVLSKMGARTAFVEPAIWIAMGFAFLAERVGAMHMQLYTLGGRVIWHWVNGLTGAAMLAGTYMLYPVLGLISIPLSMCGAYLTIYCIISIRRSYHLLSLNFLKFDIIASAPATLLLLFYGVGTLEFYKPLFILK